MTQPYTVPLFPPAQQAQIIRANQRDLFLVSSIREQADAALRPLLGTRWLTRWEQEVDLLAKLTYYGLTTGRATQTLGEEYTDIWQHTDTVPVMPSRATRVALILLSTLPSYLVAKRGTSLPAWSKMALTAVDVITEINLAVFYLRGTYYDVVKRLLGITHLSSIPENPHVRPPSYSLLGVLLGIRLLHRLINFLREKQRNAASNEKGKAVEARAPSNETYLDRVPLSTVLAQAAEDSSALPAKPAEEDEHIALDVASIPPALRVARTCTLCLEERTSSTATECGHLFCWSCIVAWGREKAECPLCRQGLSLNKLIPIYNL